MYLRVIPRRTTGCPVMCTGVITSIWSRAMRGEVSTCETLSVTPHSSWSTRSGKGIQAGCQQHRSPSVHSAGRRAVKVVFLFRFREKPKVDLVHLVLQTARFAGLLQRLPKGRSHRGGFRPPLQPRAFRVSTSLALSGCGVLGEFFPLSGFTSNSENGMQTPASETNSGITLCSPHAYLFFL